MDLKNFHKSHPEGCTISKECVPCFIRACTGKIVGSIWVPTSWLKTHSHKRGEFILLSMHIEDAKSETCQEVLKEDPKRPGEHISNRVKHVDGCEHQSYNVLLRVSTRDSPNRLKVPHSSRDSPNTISKHQNPPQKN
jgi:hypothetical protein